MPRLRFNRKIRRVQAGREKVRFDLTIPQEILDAAGMSNGGNVELRVAPGRHYIVVMPLRGVDDWPETCVDGCQLAHGHDGSCIIDDEVLA